MEAANTSSPHSSCSDNSDAVNSSTAKVYFGPLQSPEKKFTPMLSPCKPLTQTTEPLSSLLRRSPRLSSPPPPVPEYDNQDESEQEEEDSSAPLGKCSKSLWQGTPMQRFLRQDGMPMCMRIVLYLCLYSNTRTFIGHCRSYYESTRQSIATSESLATTLYYSKRRF